MKKVDRGEGRGRGSLARPANALRVFPLTVPVSSLRREAFSTKLIVWNPRYLNVHSDTAATSAAP